MNERHLLIFFLFEKCLFHVRTSAWNSTKEACVVPDSERPTTTKTRNTTTQTTTTAVRLSSTVLREQLR